MRKQTKAKYWFFILLAFTFIPDTTSAINLNPTAVKGVAEAYGFVLGQEYTLSRITKEFPELSGRVDLAQSQFDSTFPEIKAKLETQIKNATEDKLFRETTSILQTRRQEISKHQQITRETATSFLNLIKARSKGEIESPVLEYLLAVKYETNPVGEFTDGFRQRYQTDGTGGGKSQGIKLNMQLPRSWAAKEGERPHIVQKWISEHGTGPVMIHLDIRDMQGYSPSKKEMEDYVKSGNAKNSIPAGSTYMDSGNFTLEGQTGYWLEIATSLERADIKMYSISLAYQFFFREKAIGITCQAGGPESGKSRVNEAFNRVRPLCQQVLNSLVLMQAY